MESRRGQLPWLRWGGEFILIVGSVYLAVFLESASQERADRTAARVALSQLLGELRGDLADFERIIATQEQLNQDYEAMDRWLEDPGVFPVDSVGAAMRRIGVENPTLFARRGSWNTMISGGQLADLDAPALVLQLGQLYETIYTRIDYVSQLYDEELNATLRALSAIRWGDLEGQPLTTNRTEIERLAASLQRIHISWNLFYRDLLVGYEDDVESAITAVEVFLGDEVARDQL